MYTAHPDMRTHTGQMLSLRKGDVYDKSSKQKLKSKSLTESKVIGMSDYVPYNPWLIECQGYKIKTDEIFQDNQSAIQMEINARNS